VTGLDVTNDIVKSESNAVFYCASWFYGNALAAIRVSLAVYLRYFGQ
jgi:hypothetical protein